MGTNVLSDSGTVHINHIDVHHRTEGADGLWIVLTHASGVDHQLWDGAARRLVSRYRVLRYDACGRGKTGVPHGPHTLFQMVDDMAGLLDALSIGQMHFVGLSVSGMVGQALGMRHVQRLFSLTLCDTMCYTSASAHTI